MQIIGSNKLLQIITKKDANYLTETVAFKVPPANQRTETCAFPSGRIADKQLGQNLAQGRSTVNSYTKITYLNLKKYFAPYLITTLSNPVRLILYRKDSVGLCFRTSVWMLVENELEWGRVGEGPQRDK